MMRGAVPAASDVTFPKSELFIVETGVFGVIVLKTLKISHLNWNCWVPNRNDRDNAMSTFNRPGPENRVKRHRPVGAERRQPGTHWDSATPRRSDPP